MEKDNIDNSFNQEENNTGTCDKIEKENNADICNINEKENDNDKSITPQKEKLSKKEKIIISGLAVVGLFLFSISSFFVVDNIKVVGNSYYTDEEIINIAHGKLGVNIIYKSGKHKMEQYLNEDPFIKKASIHVRLPGTLLIKVEEREQIGALTYGDEYLIFDENYKLMKRTKVEPKIPIVTGFKITNLSIGEKIEVAYNGEFGKVMELLENAIDKDLYFKRIEYKKSNSVVYIYDSLACIGDIEEINHVIQNGKMKSVIENLFKDNIKRGTIVIEKNDKISFRPDIT